MIYRKFLPINQNAPWGCAARGDEVYAEHTARARKCATSAHFISFVENFLYNDETIKTVGFCRQIVFSEYRGDKHEWRRFMAQLLGGICLVCGIAVMSGLYLVFMYG